MMNIFTRNIYGIVCYSMSVEDRIRDVKSCDDIEKLKEALKTQGLQKTVENAIQSKIRKLSK